MAQGLLAAPALGVLSAEVFAGSGLRRAFVTQKLVAGSSAPGAAPVADAGGSGLAAVRADAKRHAVRRDFAHALGGDQEGHAALPRTLAASELTMPSTSRAGRTSREASFSAVS